MFLTFVSATPFEVAPLIEHLEKDFEPKGNYSYQKDNLTIDILITGVGSVLTSFLLGNYLANKHPDLIINAGVAGAFNTDLNLGDVVHVIADCFGDLGVEEADGSFTSVHEMKLIEPDAPPFEKGILFNKNVAGFDFLTKVSGTTVNKVHGHAPSIDTFKSKFQVDVESMESAAVFYACLINQIKFLAIRSISNYVESRNRDAWELGLAIKNLNQTLVDILDTFQIQSNSA